MQRLLPIALCLTIVCGAIPARAQATDCNSPEASARANASSQQWWDSQRDPVYAEAMNLARDLTRRGIVVKCVRSSKESNLFPLQKGAAWFWTDKGRFDVWFMPDSEAAATAGAKVAAHGAPISLPSGPSEFFIQYQNTVFHVSLGDQTWPQSFGRPIQASPEAENIHPLGLCGNQRNETAGRSTGLPRISP